MLPVKTPEARAKILECLRAGHTRKAAAQQAGMSHKTLWVWMREDEELCKDVKKAESESTTALLEMLRVHATQTWQTAAWLLERRDPEWRHPDTKLREKQGDKPTTPTTTVNITIGDVERELEIRRRIAATLIAEGAKTDVDRKLLVDYKDALDDDD